MWQWWTRVVSAPPRIVLEVSRSLVSRKIAQLEKHLGTQLLFRTTRKINPTDAGYALFLKCERLFSSLEEAEQSVLNLEDVPRGHLRIVCTDMLGEKYISLAATKFCQMHPQLKVDVHVDQPPGRPGSRRL